ncbi:hypothetical protein BSZ35_01295 [Salinibacter sp. 10B]|uniref:hypothetical protein n=1 Tax=Salinibacter sp. 10B TaxID=1923971 RepID=UPI000CF36A80|nr:hypothetical protein [Salinibacter sp. 10B]PQJ33412.1 hypothetical protein BSZ35_01295 [Salinibacter sp. 10B]
MTNELNRREALKWIGSTLIGGSMLTVVSGCGGGDGNDGDGDGDDSADQGPSHEVPHPNNDTLPESEAKGESLSGATRTRGGQQSQDNPGVALQHKPSGNQYCGNCSLYVPDQNGDGFGACLSVKGKIHPCDWCILYTEHSGEGVVSCA